MDRCQYCNEEIDQQQIFFCDMKEHYFDSIECCEEYKENPISAIKRKLTW